MKNLTGTTTKRDLLDQRSSPVQSLFPAWESSFQRNCLSLHSSSRLQKQSQKDRTSVYRGLFAGSESGIIRDSIKRGFLPCSPFLFFLPFVDIMNSSGRLKFTITHPLPKPDGRTSSRLRPGRKILPGPLSFAALSGTVI